MFQKTLTGADRSLPDAVEARMAIRTKLGSSKLFEAVGVVSLLRTLLDAFRNAVTDWYRLHASGVRDVDKEELGALCRSYDALYDVLPLFRLNELDEFELSMGSAKGLFRQKLRSTRLAEISYDEVLEDYAVFGTPAAVAERLMALRETMGFSTLSMWMNPGGTIPNERILKSMRLFVERVAPRLA